MVDGPRELDCPERRQVRRQPLHVEDAGAWVAGSPQYVDEPQQRRLRGAGAPVELGLGSEEAADRDAVDTAGETLAVPGLDRVRPAERVEPLVRVDEPARRSIRAAVPGRRSRASPLRTRCPGESRTGARTGAASATAGRARPGSPRAPAETTRRACRRPSSERFPAGMRRAACPAPDRPRTPTRREDVRRTDARDPTCSVAARSARDESARWQPIGGRCRLYT